MTSADYQQLFFSTIQRAPGQPADDWETVLGASGIPAGYKPWVVPDASMPFNAMTQQIGTDGRIAGRIFLPTAEPDPNGYYTHPFSPLKDGPTAGSLLWEWRDLGGPPIVTPGDTAPPVSGGVTEDQVAEMIAAAIAPLDEQIAALTETVSALQTTVAQPLHAHGPVNLPMVLQDLTHLRAIGDIDVAVVPGEAIPPAASDGGSDLNGAALLLWLRRRNDDDTAQG